MLKQMPNIFNFAYCAMSQTFFICARLFHSYYFFFLTNCAIALENETLLLRIYEILASVENLVLK